MVMMAGIVVVMVVPLQPEAKHCQAGAGPLHEVSGSGGRRQDGADVIQHPLPQLRHGIGQGCDEHVAGDAADDIEMDMPSAHAASWTGTT